MLGWSPSGLYLYLIFNATMHTASTSEQAFAAITATSRFTTPYTSHDATPRQNVANIPDTSFADLVRGRS